VGAIELVTIQMCIKCGMQERYGVLYLPRTFALCTDSRLLSLTGHEGGIQIYVEVAFCDQCSKAKDYVQSGHAFRIEHIRSIAFWREATWTRHIRIIRYRVPALVKVLHSIIVPNYIGY
jgi:hypothetical protein